MKRMISLALCAAALFAAGCPTEAEAKSRTKVSRAATSGSVKTAFNNTLGKYPYETNLLSGRAMKQRLIALMGANRYNFMVKNFDVQTPVEFSEWNYMAHACQTHNCGETEFTLSYNPEKDALAVRYMVDGTVQIFKEKNSVRAYWDYR